MKLSTETIEILVEAMKRLGWKKSLAADMAGVSRIIFYSWLKIGLEIANEECEADTERKQLCYKLHTKIQKAKAEAVEQQLKDIRDIAAGRAKKVSEKVIRDQHGDVLQTITTTNTEPSLQASIYLIERLSKEYRLDNESNTYDNNGVTLGDVFEAMRDSLKENAE